MSIEKRINQLGIILPSPKPPVGAYVATKIVGQLLYISGQNLMKMQTYNW